MSITNQNGFGNTQSNIKFLDEILVWKRKEVSEQMQKVPLATVQKMARNSPPPADFAKSISINQRVSLIAEVKRASPSKGIIAEEWDPILITETYANNGASAISCLTDQRFFQGELDYLLAIKKYLNSINKKLPVLRKDFIIHDYQVYEARMAGADAILLLVVALDDKKLKSLLNLTHDLGMQALVEIHDEDELTRALKLDAKIIGINNRDLRSFNVDIENTFRLRPQIPREKIVIAESGIHAIEDVERMVELGCNAILVGEAFCKLPQKDRAKKVRSFVDAGGHSSS